MKNYINIDSELDALKIKEVEKVFYENIEKDVKIIPKVTPFKGINTDMLYIKDNKALFIKFMDTTEDIFYILEEDLLEVMSEENDLLSLKMKQSHSDIKYNYVFVMPYVDIEEDYGFSEFIYKHIIDKSKLEEIMNDKKLLDNYLEESNNEVTLNLFMMDVCPEYYLLNSKYHLNKNFKKISFYSDDYEYSATMLNQSQLIKSISIKYGDILLKGAPGTGKTAIMLSRAIKLARIYPHHKFLIITPSKQGCNELREKVKLLYKNNNNLEIHTYSSFIFKLAKKYNLVINYSLLKKDYEKAFENLIKQAKNIIKNKKMFKGIFVDKGEQYSSEEIYFLKEFLYKTKHIFNVYSCESSNISNDLNIFKPNVNNLAFDEIIELKENYKQTKKLVEFVNNFSENANNYIHSLRENKTYNEFYKSISKREEGKSVDIIKVSDLDEQISSVIWEIEHLVEDKGLNYSDIGIVYPYNKKKLKSGKMIYFQYMLRKALDEAEIPYICADEDLTNMSEKFGITISNIYNMSNLEYKALILCELEMLYNHKIIDKSQDYQINDFVGDLNKVYSAINRACDDLTIITAFNEESSDIIKLLIESNI